MSSDFMTLGYTIDSVLSASLMTAAVFINHKSYTPPNLPPEYPKVVPELGWRQREYAALVCPVSQVGHARVMISWILYTRSSVIFQPLS